MKKSLQAQPFFIFDVESVGLHGEAFAVAGGIYIGGEAYEEFFLFTDTDIARGSSADRLWVDTNVTHGQDGNHVDKEHFGFCQTETHPCRLIRDRFWAKWVAAKALYPAILMAGECLWPVEARFLLACIDDDKETRNWEGPYPFMEIASMMEAAGMDPMGTYKRLPNESPVHDPLADARLSARLLQTAIEKLEEMDAALAELEQYRCRDGSGDYMLGSRCYSNVESLLRALEAKL